jgi:anaerobic dimethyl sulfoxide reductase subunit C (anchor subunit)
LRKLADPALYAIGPVMVIALVVSLAHLGDPLHAIFTLENFGRSWLSREIVFGVAFCVLSIVFSVGHAKNWLSPAWRELAAAVTALFGLALIFVQGMIYETVPTIPGWHTWATTVGFFVTTFLLGSLGVALAFVVVTTLPRLRERHGGDTRALELESLWWISLASMALLGVEFVVVPTFALQLAQGGPAGVQSAHLWLYGGGSVFVVEMALAFLGAGLIGFFFYWLSSRGARRAALTSLGGGVEVAQSVISERAVAYAVGAAFVLVGASEVLSRLLFYTSYARIGFGGF